MANSELDEKFDKLIAMMSLLCDNQIKLFKLFRLVLDTDDDEPDEPELLDAFNKEIEFPFKRHS